MRFVERPSMTNVIGVLASELSLARLPYWSQAIAVAVSFGILVALVLGAF
jgi:hypothetical protein